MKGGGVRKEKKQSGSSKNSNNYNPVQYVFNYKGVEELKKATIKSNTTSKRN
jgi:hypothetical protein